VEPDKFDAREWARVVKESGARYVVFLLKHHDGFCLWDTKQTDYNIMNGPFKATSPRNSPPRAAKKASVSSPITRRATGIIRITR